MVIVMTLSEESRRGQRHGPPCDAQRLCAADEVCSGGHLGSSLNEALPLRPPNTTAPF